MAAKASQATELALVKQELHQINGKLTAISGDLERKYAQQTELALVRIEQSEMRKNFVTVEQFKPIRTIVIWFVGSIAASFIGGLLGLLGLIFTKGLSL